MPLAACLTGGCATSEAHYEDAERSGPLFGKTFSDLPSPGAKAGNKWPFRWVAEALVAEFWIKPGPVLWVFTLLLAFVCVFLVFLDFQHWLYHNFYHGRMVDGFYF